MNTTLKKAAIILAFIIGCELVGILGSFSTVSSIPTWYAGLIKPPLNPPNWVFGPVWTILYALMGIAAYLVYAKGWKKKEVRSALTVFGIQLFLNAIWTPVFFGAQQLFLALLIIGALLAAILLTIIRFHPISKAAGYLLLPYLAWVCFAAYLNASLWYLNR